MLISSKGILTFGLAALAALCLCFVPASAQIVRERGADAARHSNDAAAVLSKIMGVPDKAIPRELLEGAEAVAVCPGVLKAAFVVGGRKGDCVISRRTQKRQWGAPVFYNLTGGSFGAQIGAAKTDYVLLFMNGAALGGLMKDKFEVGGEAEATAGPVGRAAGAETTPNLKAGILSYSRSRGLFAGLELKGGVINPDNNLNEALYGLKAKDILTGANKVKAADIPPGVIVFPNTLARYSIK